MTANWTTPKTWTAGELTSSDLNTEVRDRFDWVWAIMLLHGMNSPTTLGRLVGARYGCSATATSYAIGDSEDRTVMFTDAAAEWDDASFHNDVNGGRFTAPATSTYECKAYISFEPNGTGIRAAWVAKNGVTDYNLVRVTSAGASARTGIFTSVEIELAEGDYLTMLCRQNSGSTLDVDARFQIRRVSA